MSDSDPFYAGRASRRRDAEWFAEIWQRFVPDPCNIHVRRVHYILTAQDEPIILPSGAVLANNRQSWIRLIAASGDARYLGLVPLDAFVDRRAKVPIIYRPDEWLEADIGVVDREIVGFAPTPILSSGPIEFPRLPSIYFNPPTVTQRYDIEIWIEKSTQNDILEPLAHQRQVSLITGVGELSITHCEQTVRRARASGRPVRILYISDADKYGKAMPVSAARKIEFFCRQGGDYLDIRLETLALTEEQIAHYGLPRAPDTDAVELDALEALHPGELASIVTTAIDRFRDDTLESRVDALADRVRSRIEAQDEAVRLEHEDELSQLRAEWSAMQKQLAGHRRAIRDAQTAIADEVANSSRQAQTVWEAIADDLEERAPDLEAIDWPEPAIGDEADDPLFDSRRGYVEQVDRFKRYQGKPTSRKVNGGEA